MEIKNDSVRRVIEEQDGVWRTVEVSRADGSDTMQVQSDEFMILLMDGTKLTAADYRVASEPVTSKDGKRTTVTITYAPRGKPKPGAPLSVVVEYDLADRPYLRKTILLEMPEQGAVDRLEVERFRTPAVCDLGGIGEPIVMGNSWFAGLEYPGSHTEHCNGLVTLAHHPGYAKSDGEGRWLIRSKTAVLGTGVPDDPVDVAFHDYIETIRLPAAKHLLINTWSSSFRNPGSANRLLEFYDRYDKNLRPYGVEIDSLQPDLMGWQPGTLSRPRKDILPDGYKPLSEGLKKRGANLSLWLSLTGSGNLHKNFPGHEASQ